MKNSARDPVNSKSFTCLSLRILFLVTVSFFLLFRQAHSDVTAILEGERMTPVAAKEGMVVTSHFLATQAALDILKNGGNAIDAAVTAAFTLAVVQPRSGNIGGGGFMVISMENSREIVAIDYREKAPGQATETMFLNKDNEVVKNRMRYSHAAAGVPGTVAGLALALEKYGTLSLAQALAPAIHFAKNGFLVLPRFSNGIKKRALHLQKIPSSRKIFFKPDGSYYEPGDLFVQKDLAATLQRIGAYGAEEFYKGQTAKLLTKQMKAHNGLITMEDLENYTPIIRSPVHGTYRGYDVYSMPPPSSGGIHLVQILNILEPYPVAKFGHNSSLTIHLMTEAMKRAYADRSVYLGDQDFIEVPIKGLTSKKYAAELHEEIDTTRSTPSKTISAGNPNFNASHESNETTHFSIADNSGNCVSNTYTINYSFGSGIVVEGAGFLLNNEMDDFSAKPGVPNSYGMIGGEANKIEGNKRMLSSMSPTIVKKDGKNFLVTGSPGGSRIISTTLQVIMNVIDHGLNLQSAVTAPRVHHQWLPDEIRIEEGINPDTISNLGRMGHKIVQKQAMGGAQSILLSDGMIYGAADPRRSTALAAGR